MKILCKLGFHKWRFYGFANLMLSDSLSVCSRCGCGRMAVSFGMAEMRYTPEQVKTLTGEATDGRG